MIQDRLQGPKVLIVAVVILSCGDVSGQDADPSPSFTRDVAPIIFKNCTVCHRPGQSAPFSLLNYRDAMRRAKQIVQVTGSRYMPPWLPDRNGPAFDSNRSLSDEQIQIIRRWVEAGTPEGDPDDLPAVPQWEQGWALGPPDLVLTLEAYELGAEDLDVFRNIVVANPLESVRYVQALEFRPESLAVHHAIIQVDRSATCRRQDLRDPGPGFGGMDMGRSEAPDGHFIGWTPGKATRRLPDKMAWLLHPKSDLVVQMHLTATGKIEWVEAQIGLYFTDDPPQLFPCNIVLSREDIDIPAGRSDHLIEDEYVFPADAHLVVIYPHAHYLGKDVHVTAVFPDGQSRSLLHIGDWDFNWQDDYRYAEPIALPRGTRLTMRWQYDNSRDNPRNPYQPPRRVRYGLRSEDEMGTVSLQVLPDNPEDQLLLQLTEWRSRVRKNPGNWYAMNVLAAALLEHGSVGEAMRLLKRVQELNPDFPDGANNLGRALLMKGKVTESIGYFRRTLRLQPDHDSANAALGSALVRLGQTSQAITHYREVLEKWPHLYVARVRLGNLLADRGQLAEAMGQYRVALDTHPGLAEAHQSLAVCYMMQRQFGPAIEHYRRTIALQPENANAHFALGRCLQQQNNIDAALEHLGQAVRLDPENELYRRILQQLRGGKR